MSKSTPADLAIAFRSLDRRRGEAVEAAEGAPVDALLSDLDHHIAAAATLVGGAPSASGVADALNAKPAKNWDDATLEAVRDHATAAGTTLRRITEAGQSSDDE